MTRLRLRSLRKQLLLMVLISAMLPLAALLGVVFATTSDEDVLSDPSVIDPNEFDIESFEDSNSGVPTPVPVAALGLALTAIVGVWWWSGRAIGSLEKLTRVTNSIEATSLDRRVDMDGAASEVQELADSFDRMLDRLARSARVQEQLLEDTSHELRTPLAALAINNEVVLSASQPTLDEYRQSAERSEALIERLQVTIDQLLSEARSRNAVQRQQDNDLVAVAQRVAARHRLLNPEAQIVVDAPDQLRIGIEGPSVERALDNLLENAIRHSPAKSPVLISIAAGPPATVSVTDHGPGIPVEHHEQIFDRYYRGEDSSQSGNGIGLAIVKHVADAHGGIVVESPLPDGESGARFTMLF